MRVEGLHLEGRAVWVASSGNCSLLSGGMVLCWDSDPLVLLRGLGTLGDFGGCFNGSSLSLGRPRRSASRANASTSELESRPLVARVEGSFVGFVEDVFFDLEIFCWVMITFARVVFDRGSG